MVTRERSEGERTVTPTEAGARPTPTKAGARAARVGKIQGSEKSDEKGIVSKTAATKKRDRKAQQVKKAPATGPAPMRSGGKAAAAVRRRTEPQLVQPLVAAPRVAATNAADAILEGAVDSLRRLLSELIEQRMEAIVRDLAEVRSEAASSDDGGRVVERLDQLLESLGGVKFAAPRFDAMDPLIHVAVEERHEEGIPDGVILATVRPGFRTGRGLVLCKAAVAVNRGV